MYFQQLRKDINDFFITTIQALEHSEAAVELCTSNETKSDAYHVRGSVLKDLGRMEEAESVSLMHECYA